MFCRRSNNSNIQRHNSRGLNKSQDKGSGFSNTNDVANNNKHLQNVDPKPEITKDTSRNIRNDPYKDRKDNSKELKVDRFREIPRNTPKEGREVPGDGSSSMGYRGIDQPRRVSPLTPGKPHQKAVREESGTHQTVTSDTNAASEPVSNDLIKNILNLHHTRFKEFLKLCSTWEPNLQNGCSGESTNVSISGDNGKDFKRAEARLRGAPADVVNGHNEYALTPTAEPYNDNVTGNGGGGGGGGKEPKYRDQKFNEEKYDHTRSTNFGNKPRRMGRSINEKFSCNGSQQDTQHHQGNSGCRSFESHNRNYLVNSEKQRNRRSGHKRN